MRYKNPFLFIIAVTIVGIIGATILASRNTTPELQPQPEEVKPHEIIHLKNGDTYTLTAAYVTKDIGGHKQTMLAYNGMIPGPEIHVAQGAEVAINFKNDTDLPALLHSHGVRMDNAFDGSQLQQEEIPPGGSFTYTLTFPDAGVFWYHPHTYEVYEQALGLYGAFVVEPKDAAYYPPAHSQHVLFLSDLPTESGRITLTKERNDQVLMGHYGQTMLINGQEHFTLKAKTNEVIQLSLVNAANVRPFNIAIAGAKLKQLGSDSGSYEKATWQDSIILGPSERAIVDVMFPTAGTYALQNNIPSGPVTLGNIVVGADVAEPSYTKEFNTLQENAAVKASIDPFRAYIHNAVDKKLTLSVDLSGMMAGHTQSMGGMHNGMSMGIPDDGIEWENEGGMMQMMNSMATTKETRWKITDSATGKSNMAMDWVFKKDKPVRIEIYNDPNSAHPMQHPIHFHGQRFLVLSVNGVAQTNLVWKDTVMVPAGATVDILLDPSNPGTWMAHCHISEHLEAGMMFTFKVE